jgi:acetyl-CoA acetyltransferase
VDREGHGAGAGAQPGAARSNPYAQVSGDVTVEDLLGRPYVAEPLRVHDCAPVGDGAAAVVIASASRARELCEQPAWIGGFGHRIDSGSLGARDLLAAPSAAAAGRPCTPDPDGIEVAELHAPALQVMGKAGAHQVEGARTALGHAYGGGSQFFSMWVVSSTPS